MQDLKELSDESTRKELAKYNPMFETKKHVALKLYFFNIGKANWDISL